ncbi:MAG TPA: DUF1015 domain-containing protein [Candidatus Sumerlaeota bacterium]|nr:DUF1015 domain-containing protein [Candidatus Sumerlaeota bacterium]
MAEIIPFIGTRFNSRLIEEMKTVISPPYDTLTPESQEVYRNSNPNNIMHIVPTFTNEDDTDYNNAYQRASSQIQAWRRDGILVNDGHRSYYFYERVKGGAEKKIICRGVYALVNLGKQKPKNLTVEGTTPYLTKSFHLKLLRATRCNIAPVPLFFRDPKGDFQRMGDAIAANKPWEEIEDNEGDIHRLWVINKKEAITRITQIFADKQSFLVDGHQRYEVAIRYRNEQRETSGKTRGDQPFDHVMVFLSPFDVHRICTRPVHRVLSSEIGASAEIGEILEDLAVHFNVQQLKVKLKETGEATSKILGAIADKGKKTTCIAMALQDGRVFALTLKDDADINDLFDEETKLSESSRKMDVNILYHHIIRQNWIGNPELELEEEDILYVDEAEAALRMLAERKAAAVFLLNACPQKHLEDALNSGDTIPPFTARFNPPLATGLVIRDMSVRQ